MRRNLLAVFLVVMTVTIVAWMRPTVDDADVSPAGRGDGRGIGGFARPRDVALAADGTMFVLDCSGWIYRLSEAGEKEPFIRLETRLGNPEGIHCGAGSVLWLADTHNNRIVRFSGEDGDAGRWGGEPDGGTDPGSLFWPCAVAESPTGEIYTLEYGGHDRVQRWSATGEWLGAWGRFGEAPGEFRRPSGLTVASDGTVYVADSINNRIQRFTAEGLFLCAWNGEETARGRLACPYAVAMDPAGRVAVLEFAASRIRLFTPEGEEVGAWGGPGRNERSLLYPWSFAIGSDGSTVVADTQNNRVMVLNGKEWQDDKD